MERLQCFGLEWRQTHDKFEEIFNSIENFSVRAHNNLINVQKSGLATQVKLGPFEC